MKISLLQIHSGADKEANYSKATKYITEAAIQNTDIICLPECFLYAGDDNEKSIKKLSSKYIVAFQEVAKNYNVNLILGSIILESTMEEKPTNSCIVINRKGEIIHRYDKQYMYDVEQPGFSFKESDIIKPGNKMGLFEVDGVKMGVGICVDLRYPEYFRELVKNGAEIIFLPASFRKLTGRIAWDILPQARAIENQTYFCACNQTGGESNKERCGNSRIISFEGTIISEVNQEEGIISADLDLEAQRRFSKEFPVLRQIK